MIRFFRTIRQSLVKEGKTVKYLKYAVGEFLLIVGEILVALQIQTWNENRKLEQDRRDLIENLKTDFQVNLEGLVEATATHETNFSNLTEFLRLAHADNSYLSVNELKSQSRRVPHTFTPTLGTYQSARDDGSLALIDD